MSDVYVKHVVSNIKAGVNIELGPKTLIVGPNASGKSSITQSVELALTGRASDIAGRIDVAREAELLSMAPDGVELHVEATLSDGSKATFTVPRKGKAVHSTPPASLPLRHVLEAIRGSPETARKFFLAVAVGILDDAGIVARLPTPLQARYRNALVGAQGATAVDRLLAVLEASRARSREAAAKGRAADAAAAESATGLPAPPVPGDLDRLRLADDAARIALATAQVAQNGALQRAAQAAGAHSRIAALRGQAQGLMEDHSRLRVALDLLGPREDLPVGGLDAGAVLRTSEIHTTMCATECAICGRVAPADVFPAQLEVLRAAIQAKRLAYEGITQREHGRDAAMLKIREVERDLASLEREAETLIPFVAAQAPQASQPVDLAALAAVAEAAGNALLAASRSDAAWTASRRSRDAALLAEREAKEWKELGDAVAVVVAELLDGGVMAFAARVQTYLPSGDRFGLRLRDGNREVCQVGLMRGDAVHTALSGAEWARVTAALAFACSGGSAATVAVVVSPATVVIPEERAFDPETLTVALEAFSASPFQILVTSPVAPSRLPPGWTLVSCGSQAPREGNGASTGPLLIQSPKPVKRQRRSQV